MADGRPPARVTLLPRVVKNEDCGLEVRGGGNATGHIRRHHAAVCFRPIASVGNGHAFRRWSSYSGPTSMTWTGHRAKSSSKRCTYLSVCGCWLVAPCRFSGGGGVRVFNVSTIRAASSHTPCVTAILASLFIRNLAIPLRQRVWLQRLLSERSWLATRRSMAASDDPLNGGLAEGGRPGLSCASRDASASVDQSADW